MREFTANNLHRPQVFEMAGESNRGISSIIQKAECGRVNGKTGVVSKIVIETTIDKLSVTVPLPGRWKKTTKDIYAFEPQKEGACEEILIIVRRDDL